MKKIFLAIAAAGLLMLQACSDTGDANDSVDRADDMNERKSDSLNIGDSLEDDHEFVVEAASAGLMEVELGEKASRDAVSADVRAFGQMMVKDHTAANNELKTLAAAKNITIPSSPGSDHQRHIDQLKEKTGAEFDRDYMNMMVNDHQEVINDFEEAVREVKDPEIRAFAEKTIPTLKQHLSQAQAIRDKLK